MYLSTDENPANRILIANNPVWNNSRDWTGTDQRPFGENISRPIALVAGQRYYIQVHQSDGGGADHVAVAWKKPSDLAPPVNGSEPIPGAYLEYFVPPPASAFPVHIPDPGLQNAIRIILNKPSGPITISDMERLIDLNALAAC